MKNFKSKLKKFFFLMIFVVSFGLISGTSNTVYENESDSAQITEQLKSKMKADYNANYGASYYSSCHGGAN